MVFITVGKSKKDFKRLFREIDKLAEMGIIKDIKAQIGYTDYEPKHYNASQFLSPAEMNQYIKEADFIICHGGAGTLEECLENRKKVIVVPRYRKFHEASDDHQLEITHHLAELDRALPVFDMSELKDRVNQVVSWTPRFINKKEKDNIALTIIKYIEGDV